MKKAFYFLLSLCLTLGLLKVYDKAVDGFYPSRIKPIGNTPFSFTSDLSEESKKAMQQPYYYLASGSQSFVFVSEDGKYVLKFFKNYRWKKPWYFSFLPLKNSYKEKVLKKREEGFLSTCQSSLYSYEEMKEETGLLFLQIEASNLDYISLKDRLHISHKVALEGLSFALQYKAIGIKETLLKYRKDHDTEKAETLIDNLFTFVLKRKEKGLTDKDPNFLNNFGIYKGNILNVDIGGFIKDPNKDMQYFFTKELLKSKKVILPWIAKHYPELTLYTENKFYSFASTSSKKPL